jgi:hypothetical protein
MTLIRRPSNPLITDLGFSNPAGEKRVKTYAGSVTYNNLTTIAIDEDGDGHGYSKITSLIYHVDTDYRYPNHYSLAIRINNTGTWFTYYILFRVGVGDRCSIPIITSSNPIYLNGNDIEIRHTASTAPVSGSGGTGSTGDYTMTVERYYV